MDTWHVVTLALAALLVGALLPAVLQLTLALRAWGAAATRTQPALTAVTDAAERVDRLIARFEEGGRLERLLQVVDGLTVAAGHAREALKVAAAVGAAVGPAVGAAVRAWREAGVDDAGAPAGAPAPAQEAAGKDQRT